MGLVDFRSDKERIARNSKQTAKAIKEQTKQDRKLAEEQMRVQQGIAAANASHQALQAQAAAVAPPAAAGPPPGWYNDPDGEQVERWWDGSVWSEHTRNRS